MNTGKYRSTERGLGMILIYNQINEEIFFSNDAKGLFYIS